MRLSRLLALPLAGALVLAPALATPAFAASHHNARTVAVSHHAAKVRRVPFNAVGTVTAVDPAVGTITVAVRSGTRGLRGTTITATVTPGAHIIANDAPITLADVAVASTVTLGGTRSGSAFTATRVLVH
jgi:hypothetical protein